MPYVGQLIYGFCAGFFGRDSYNTKRIEAVGVDWIVARELKENAKPEFAQFDNRDQMEREVAEWNQQRES